MLPLPQACLHALALGVSEEEVQQALQAEHQLMRSKVQVSSGSSWCRRVRTHACESALLGGGGASVTPMFRGFAARAQPPTASAVRI